MPLTLRLGTDDLTRCRFAVSPLCQTHEALRLLRRPARHAFHRDWLRRARGVVAGLDLSELWLYFPRKGGYTPDFLGPPPEAPDGSIEAELARMRATDPAMARTELARSLACTPGAARTPYGRAALDDPAAAVRRLADLTERAWQALLAPDWARHRALLEADIAHRTRQWAEGGLEALLGDLHPEIGWADDTLTLRTYPDHAEAQGADGRGVLLMPSVFVRPDVVSGFARPWQPTVIYPARGAAGSGPVGAEAPRALARLLGPHRAAILAGLATPASTSALAGRHGLAPSSVSAHLSVLREAGLVVPHRRGYYVLYARTTLGEALTAGA
ncbi:DUF5937 family protein [Streptomyces sp. NPDC005813]|uniref:ArsR/SmtB family transcription factor n=1 Tax=Streptomyces sp. NPDC005813 TaxID=3155592 RepID=UPI0033CAA8AC